MKENIRSSLIFQEANTPHARPSQITFAILPLPPGNLVVSKEGRKRQSSDLSRKRPNTPQNGDFKTISFYAKTHYP